MPSSCPLTPLSPASEVPWIGPWMKLACLSAAQTRLSQLGTCIVDRKCYVCVGPKQQNALPPSSSSCGNTYDAPASRRSSDPQIGAIWIHDTMTRDLQIKKKSYRCVSRLKFYTMFHRLRCHGMSTMPGLHIDKSEYTLSFPSHCTAASLDLFVFVSATSGSLLFSSV